MKELPDYWDMVQTGWTCNVAAEDCQMRSFMVGQCNKS